jgi:uncharacterized membrane protein YccC
MSVTAIDWLGRELSPSPGREARALRLVAGVALVTVLSMALQIPEAAVSAYMVFFVTKENRALTTLTGAFMIVGVTLAIAATLFLYRFTFDHAEFRVPLMAVVVFGGMFLSRVFVIGPLGFAIGFVVAVTQSVAETIPDGETLVRAILWLWVVIVYPIALTIALNAVLAPPGALPPHAPGPKSLLRPDAFTNPAHVHYALKVTVAAMSCYVIYTGLDWPGIHTAFITCCFIALETEGATRAKGRLRLIGCCLGGLMGFLSLMYLVPRMESITSLVLLVAAGSLPAAWVAAGSERIAYAGLQIALAFYLSIFQGFAPGTDFEKIRDRVVGIILGVAICTATFAYFWPEEPKDRSDA